MQKIRIKFAYRTGFRRLWAVLSVIWLLIGLYAHFANAWAWSEFFQVTILPIIVVYALGAAAAWIIEGFAKPDDR